MENIKIGYFRRVYHDQTLDLTSYIEYNNKSDAEKEQLREETESGRVRLFCACSKENDLELMITKKWVIRVKNNGKQDLHKNSCPKSEKYASYIVENERGLRIDDNN